MIPTLSFLLVICLSVCNRVDAFIVQSSARTYRTNALTMNSRPISSRDSAVQDIRQKVSILSSTLLLIAPSIVLADQGSLTKSTVDQAKKAAMHIQGSFFCHYLYFYFCTKPRTSSQLTFPLCTYLFLSLSLSLL